MKRKILLLIFIPAVGISCVFDQKRVDFYRDDKLNNRVARLPIKEPYQLLSANCCKTWILILPDSISGDILHDYPVDSINFEASNILIYSDKSSLYRWAVINIEDRTIFTAHEFIEFEDFAKRNKIHRKLFSAEVVYDSWKSTKELPWKVK